MVLGLSYVFTAQNVHMVQLLRKCLHIVHAVVKKFFHNSPVSSHACTATLIASNQKGKFTSLQLTGKIDRMVIVLIRC